MTRKRINNKIIEIKPDFESILVCDEKEACPFIQVLLQEPENIDSQNLGTLIGVFEVTDQSDDSSYIVNYLVSVIKKEYFSKPKRGPIESLEASLHKANLALSNLAQHGNIAWLGKINALIAVTEKNGLHLSQAGNASAFLLRAKILTDISEGLSQNDNEPNPMKTFVNVSSGRMEENDKLLITTPGIFDIFSLEEIKKSSLRFSRKDFVQFLRTALGNELDRVAVIIADFDNKEITLKKSHPTKSLDSSLNAFSNTTFKEKPKNKLAEKKIAQQSLDQEVKKAQAEFVDEKTGHIYIKEDLYTQPNEHEERRDFQYKENFSIFLKNSSSSLFKTTSSLKNSLCSFIWRGNQDFFRSIGKIKKRPSAMNSLTTYRNSWQKSMMRAKNAIVFQSLFSSQRKQTWLSFSRKILSTLRNIFFKATPQFRKIWKLVLEMDYAQRIYSLLALVLIFIVPLFIVSFLNQKAAEKSLPLVPEVPREIALPLEQDKNVQRIEKIEIAFSTENSIINTIELNEQLYAITNQEIVDLEKNKSFPFPQDFGVSVYAKEMNDLNLIFLINKNNDLISFSPTSGDFQKNSLSVPPESQISAMGTYLTYIYLADANSRQIYRYPRTEGGFGEKTNWLKDDLDLNNIVNLSINESVFIAKNEILLKLFRGKKEAFVLETTTTPTNIDQMSVEKESGNILLLDKKNSRLLYFNQDGELLKQLYHPQIQEASGLALREKNNLIYVSIEKNIYTLPLK